MYLSSFFKIKQNSACGPGKEGTTFSFIYQRKKRDYIILTIALYNKAFGLLSCSQHLVDGIIILDSGWNSVSCPIKKWQSMFSDTHIYRIL